MERPPLYSRTEAVDEVLGAAFDLPPEDRNRFVRERCAGDFSLEKSVLHLLGKFDQLGDFLESPAVGRAPDLSAGAILSGRFRILRKLGVGGMGEVYQAQDEILQDIVALKLIRSDFRGDSTIEARFREEIRLSRRIAHPNVCRTFDVFSDSRSEVPMLFFTMEFLDGQTLAARLKLEGRLALSETLEIATQVAAGLDAAHACGIVHRDLKPGNIILVPAEANQRKAVITDFGLARWSDARGGSETAPGQLLGSPDYMAPEQFLETEVSAATDIYALALIVFEMASGTRPFQDPALLRAALRRCTRDAPPLSSVCQEAPRDWDRAIARALARDPAGRPASAERFVRELRQAKTMPGRWNRRAVARIAAGVSAASLFAVALRFHNWGKGKAPANPKIMFVNASAAGSESQTASAFALLIERQLDHTPISMLPASRIDEIWGRMHPNGPPLPQALQPAQAREIALRAGQNLIAFTGATRKLDDWSFWLRLELLGSSPSAPVSWWEHEFKTSVTGDRFTASIEATRWLRETVGSSVPLAGLRQRTPQELTTSNWEALEEFMQAQDARGDSDAAIRHLRTALDLDPDFALAASRLADLLNSAGRIDEARAFYSRAADVARRRNLTDLESLRMQTLFALDAGLSGQAEQSAARWAAESPNDVEPLVHQATALERLGHPDAALRLLNIAVGRNDGMRSPRMRRAMLLLRMARFTEAETDCRRLFAIPPADATWQLSSALAFARLDLAEAWRALEQMANAGDARTQSTAFNLQACFRAEQGRRQDAYRILQEGIRFERERVRTAAEAKKRRLQAQLLILDRQFSEARRQCRLVMEANLGHAVTMETGCLLAQAGDLAGARACLRRDLADWPIYTHWSALLQGELALASGDASRAGQLMSAAPKEPSDAEWPSYIVRAASAARQPATVREWVGRLISNPARYYFNADFTGPGFLNWVLHSFADDIDPSLKTQASALRQALANSQ